MINTEHSLNQLTGLDNQLDEVKRGIRLQDTFGSLLTQKIQELDLLHKYVRTGKISEQEINALSKYLIDQGVWLSDHEQPTALEVGSALFMCKKMLIEQRQQRDEGAAFLEEKQRGLTPEIAERIGSLAEVSHEREGMKQLLETVEKQTLETSETHQVVGKVLDLVDILERDRFDRDALTLALSQVNVELPRAKIAFTAADILGGDRLGYIYQLIEKVGKNKQKAPENISLLKDELLRILLSTRTTATVLFLSVVESGKLTRRGESGEQLRAYLSDIGAADQLFAEFDHLLAITSQAQSVRTLMRSEADNEHADTQYSAAIAALLARQLEKGQLDGPTAQELYYDLVTGEPDMLLARYWTSFQESTLPFHEKYNPRLKKQTHLAWILSGIFVTGMAVAHGEKIIKTIEEIWETAFSVADDLFAEVGIDLPDAPELELIPEKSEVQRRQEFLEEIAAREAVNATRPVNADELKYPEVDKMSGAFSPGAAGYEGFARGAREVKWEMHNWSVTPNFLSAVNYTTIDQATSSFQNDFAFREERGQTLPMVYYEGWEDKPNLLVGTRNQPPLEWAGVEHPIGMVPEAAAVWVFVDGQIQGTYPVEWLASDQTFDQFARVVMTPEDHQWVSQQTGKLQFKLVYQFREDSNERFEAPHQDYAPFISLEQLPPELSSLITELNGSDATDQEKMHKVVEWFHSFGMYSLNPADDQYAYLSDRQYNSFLQVFFLGESAPVLEGQNVNSPAPGVGECNRRNSALWGVMPLLQLSGDWAFVLDSGSAVHGSQYSTDEQMIRGNQSHMRMLAINTQTQEILVLDATHAPETESQTESVLSANAAVTGLPEASAGTPTSESAINFQPEPVIDLENWHYEPEATEYPTVAPQVSFNASDFEWVFDAQALPSTWRYLIDESHFPWELISLTSLNDMSKGFFANTPIFPIYMSENGEFSVPEVWDEDPTPLLHPTLVGGEQSRVSYAIKMDGSTNIVPVIFGEFSDQGVVMDRTTVRIDGRDVPFRFVVSQNTSAVNTFASNMPAIVVDLPPSVLKDQIVTVELSSASRRSPDFDVERYNLRSLDEVISDLESWGLTEDEVVRSYVEYSFALSANYSYMAYSSAFSEFTLQEYVEQHPMTRVIAELEGRDAEKFQKLITILKVYKDLDLVSTPDELTVLVSELDQNYPDLAEEWFLHEYEQFTKHAGDYPYLSGGDIINSENRSSFGVTFDTLDEGSRELFKFIEDGGEISLLGMYRDEPNGDAQLQNYLANYTIWYYLPETLPWEIPPQPNSRTTAQVAQLEACSQLSNTYGDMMRCARSTPYFNRLQDPALRFKMWEVITGRESPPPYVLRVEEDGNFLIGENYQPHSYLNISRAGEDRLPTLFFHDGSGVGLYYQKEDGVQLPQGEIDRFINEERIEMNDWYREEIFRGLKEANPQVWMRFLTLFLPAVALTLYGTSLVGNLPKKRWSLERDAIDMITKRKKKKLSLLEDVALETGTDLHDLQSLITADLDTVWQQKRNLTQTQRLQRLLVTHASLHGERPTFPLFHLAEKKIKKTNPWESTKVPPTYNLHLELAPAQLELWTEALQVNTEDVGFVASTIETTAREGISNRSFAENQLVLTDQETWKKIFTETLVSNLAEITDSAVAAELVTPIVEDIANRWLMIMRDDREFNPPGEKLRGRLSQAFLPIAGIVRPK